MKPQTIIMMCAAVSWSLQCGTVRDRAAEPEPLSRIVVKPHANPPESLYHAADIRARWMGRAVVLRFPESLTTDSGTMFLDHVRADMPTKTDARTLLNKWIEREDGSLQFEWSLPDNMTAGGLLIPHSDEVDLEFWVTNGSQQPTKVHTQFCLVMRNSAFDDRELTRSYVHVNGEWRCMRDANRGPNKWQLCHYPLVGGPDITGLNKNPDGWGASTDRADVGMLAVRSISGHHVLGIVWTNPRSLLSNAFIPCIHADPTWARCAPGETVRVRGKLYLIEGTLDDLLSRWLRDFKK